MNPFKYTFLAFSLICTLPLVSAANKLEISLASEAAILINADTGAILYEKNATDQYYPASITKVVTAAVALGTVGDKLDVLITADQDSIGTVKEETLRQSNYTMPAYLLIPDGSHIGIKRGEQLTLRDLLYGMMLASGDDASNVIAKFAAGTIPKFVEEMNAYVLRLGCTKTNFCNPHGLHHPKQVTSAYDMALVACEALKDPRFREIVATVRYKRPKTNKQDASILLQTNKLLRPGPYYYPKAIGVKTGYYSLAGSTFVGAAKEGDRTLIAVLLKAPERKDIFEDAKKLFESAFNQPKVQKVVLHKGVQSFTLDLPGAKKPVTCVLDEDVTIDYYPLEEPTLKGKVIWDSDLKAPISKGQWLGDVTLLYPDGRVYKEVPLHAGEDVDATFFHRIWNAFDSPTDNMMIKLSGALAIGLVVAFFFLWRRNGS